MLEHADRARTEKSYKDGLMFYRPEPYPVVTDKETDIVWLPNMNEEYVIRPKGGFGSSEISATIENGWNLTGFGLVWDSKVPETISSITGGMVGMLAKSKGGIFEEEESRQLEPGFYRIIFTNGVVSGLERINLQ